ncbi:hypothetical protein CYMTET_37927 [Cymbomonas tetramitiformis]|uniref:Cilia- and flagella-associated protein 53 n=1 Tax=Cymbomonas tetramitiformis TaxID=36881 RepID=A0AAE0CCY9_9CHLO|nr:hypothetical protein CYMTET_37927 [Cymbomonas tetramitiformis]
MFKQQKKPPPDARILKMRDVDEKNKEMCNHVQALNKKLHVANWEIVTDTKIQRNVVNERYESLKAQAEAQLDVRRQRLAEKLYEEDIALQIELKSNQETPEERRAKMVERAKVLYEEREQERQQFANEKLYEHWRDSNDTLRGVDSKKVLLNAEAERKVQREHKVQLKVQEKQEQALYDEMYEHERLKKELRYQQDVKRRKELDTEAVRVLNNQLKDNEERREEDAMQKEEEVAAMKRQWAAEDDDEAAAEEERNERARALSEELVRFNMQKMEEKAEQAQTEADEDKAIVDMAVRRAKDEEDRENEMKDRIKEEARMYRQHQLIMTAKEAEDTAERDRLIEVEAEKAYAKRKAEFDREAAARANLMKDVLSTREAQLEDKTAMRQAAMQDRHNDRMRMQQEVERLEDAEQDHAFKLRQARLQNRMDLEAQMRQKENAKTKEKMEASRGFEGGQRAETMYKTLIQSDNQEPRQNFGRKATQWYS